MLLAELLSREIDDSLLRLLRIPEVRRVVETAAPEAGDLVDGNWDGARFEEHAVEFCRLFVYPGVCAPNAERWAENLGENHLSVRRWFGDGEAPEFTKRIAELPDTHVAKILVVPAGLADADGSFKTDYDTQMIRPWAARFAEALEEQSRFPIYRAAGAIVAALR